MCSEVLVGGVGRKEGGRGVRAVGDRVSNDKGEHTKNLKYIGVKRDGKGRNVIDSEKGEKEEERDWKKWGDCKVYIW